MGNYIKRVISDRAQKVLEPKESPVLPPATPNPQSAPELIPGPPASLNPQAQHYPERAYDRRTYRNPASKGTAPFIIDHHSAAFSNDNTTAVFRESIAPDFWLVVARTSAGEIRVSLGEGSGSRYYRIFGNGTIRLPVWVGNPTLSVVNVGVTGNYDVYACKGVGPDFDIKA